MSGIFKGDSIYKSGGGGGGGYKDGGSLVDADFIEVQNNTISTYDNTARDPVNLYFEIADGEVLNSVVEITTAVNATVNVYVVKNGFLYLLGNVGGDTITAGNDYKVNITGDSYAIENVSIPTPDPEFVSLMGVIYPLVKINGLLWISQNFKGNVGTYYDTNGTRYYVANTVKSININDFVLPTEDDVSQMKNAIYPSPGDKIKSTSGWYGGGNGTNETGLDVKPYGYLSADRSLQMNTRQAAFIALSSNTNVYTRVFTAYDSSNISLSDLNYSVEDYYNVRLVYKP